MKQQPVHFNGYEIMWLFVFFDLPVKTKKERKAANGFRKDLLNFEVKTPMIGPTIKAPSIKRQLYQNAAPTNAMSIKPSRKTSRKFAETLYSIAAQLVTSRETRKFVRCLWKNSAD